MIFESVPQLLTALEQQQEQNQQGQQQAHAAQELQELQALREQLKHAQEQEQLHRQACAQLQAQCTQLQQQSGISGQELQDLRAHFQEKLASVHSQNSSAEERLAGCKKQLLKLVVVVACPCRNVAVDGMIHDLFCFMWTASSFLYLRPTTLAIIK